MDCYGHGTHVTGILAAQKNDYGFIGAAPDAEYWAYKVFGCVGGAANDVLVASVYQAFEDGADIISSSVSINSGWADEFLAIAATEVTRQGTPCVFGAGNFGYRGLWTVGSAAAGDGVLGIGSVENTLMPTKQHVSEYSVDGGRENNFTYTPGSPQEWDGVELPLWKASGNACDSTSGELPDLSDLVVLLSRGDCSVEEMAVSFIKAGAQYIVVESNGDDAPAFYLDDLEGVKAVATVSSDIGSKWTRNLDDGEEIVLFMTGPDTAESVFIFPPNRETGGALSAFTSWGPTWDLKEAKPSFSAPGGWILSTFALDQGGYAVLSGTSMSTPLVAGAYALVSQVRGTLDPETLRSVFSATSDPLNFHDLKEFLDYLAPVPQQGGGIITAYDAAFTTTLLEPSQLSFGDTPNFKETLNFTIINEGKKEVTYEIRHVPAVSVYTFNGNSVYPAEFPNAVFDDHVSLSFSDTKITLSAGDLVVVDVSANAEGIDSDRLPVWSGWVTVNGTDGTSLSLPYQGVSGSLNEQTVLESSAAWISSTDDPNFKAVANDTKFSLPSPGSAPQSPLPMVSALLALSTTTLRADVVSVDENSNIPTKDFFGTKTIGQVASYPRRYTPRNGYPPVPWAGMLDNGEFVPKGRYNIVLRALRIFGDPEKGDDWDVAETGTLRIEYA